MVVLCGCENIEKPFCLLLNILQECVELDLEVQYPEEMSGEQVPAP